MMGDADAVLERVMDRAARGDLAEPIYFDLIQVAAEDQLQIDRRGFPLGRFPCETHREAIERPLPALGIQPNREDR